MTETTKEEPKTREEILRINYDARIQEVMHYQINIDNYTLALENTASITLAFFCSSLSDASKPRS